MIAADQIGLNADIRPGAKFADTLQMTAQTIERVIDCPLVFVRNLQAKTNQNKVPYHEFSISFVGVKQPSSVMTDDGRPASLVLQQSRIREIFAADPTVITRPHRAH